MGNSLQQLSQIITIFKKSKLRKRYKLSNNKLGDIALYQGINKPFNDITQRSRSYSENNINLKSILSYQPYEKLKLALGSEYNYWYYGPEWGKAKNSFVMDFPAPIKFAVLDTTSGFLFTI